MQGSVYSSYNNIVEVVLQMTFIFKELWEEELIVSKMGDCMIYKQGLETINFALPFNCNLLD